MGEETQKTIFGGLVWRHQLPIQVLLADIRERGGVLYLGMAQEFWDFANLAITWHGLNAYQTATSATERLTQLRPSL